MPKHSTVRPFRLLLTGLASLSLLVSLSGCVKPATIRTEVVVPPASLLVDTPAPAFSGTSTGELVPYIRELRLGLDSCNDDKAAVRTFIKETK